MPSPRNISNWGFERKGVSKKSSQKVQDPKNFFILFSPPKNRAEINLNPIFRGCNKKSSQKVTFSCRVVSGATGQKREKNDTTKKPLRWPCGHQEAPAHLAHNNPSFAAHCGKRGDGMTTTLRTSSCPEGRVIEDRIISLLSAKDRKAGKKDELRCCA